MAKKSKKKIIAVLLALAIAVALWFTMLRYFGKLVTYDNVHISYVDWMGTRHGLASIDAMKKFPGKGVVMVYESVYNRFRTGDPIL